jgi:regulator of protease activity HflC (stomatin/prohibitin superfamily)
MLGCAGVVGIIVVLGALLSFHPVDAGFVGVVTSFGKVQQDTLKPGSNFLMPFVYSVTNVDTRVHGIPFGQDPNQRFGAASREYQDVFLQGTLNIHVDQNAAVDLYQKVGLDYDQKLVIPFFSTAIKEVVPQYNIGDILAKREEIRRLTVEKLQAKLQPYGIVVDDVAIANIDFSDQYKQAIEAKQVAEQQVQTESQILAQKKIQADQVRVAAQGQADAAVIAAKGQAEANRVLQASLTPALIQYTLVQKLAPTIQTMLLPSGQNFILDPSTLLPKAQP